MSTITHGEARQLVRDLVNTGNPTFSGMLQSYIQQQENADANNEYEAQKRRELELRMTSPNFRP